MKKTMILAGLLSLVATGVGAQGVQCLPCPEGTYNDGSSTACKPCPGLADSGYVGATKCPEPCPGGYYCLIGDGSSKQICPAGNYCPEGSNLPIVNPPNSTSDQGAATFTCDANFYKSGASCFECPADQWSNAGGTCKALNCPGGQTTGNTIFGAQYYYWINCAPNANGAGDHVCGWSECHFTRAYGGNGNTAYCSWENFIEKEVRIGAAAWCASQGKN